MTVGCYWFQGLVVKLRRTGPATLVRAKAYAINTFNNTMSISTPFSLYLSSI